jgi:hypothetical protein
MTLYDQASPVALRAASRASNSSRHSPQTSRCSWTSGIACAASRPESFISKKRSSCSKHSSQPISTSRVSAISCITALKIS